uniref:PKD2-2 n=1 Tax=Schmidtea mediterranea TaxID=79327 RepID=A0A0H3YKM7_SCHMD|nr:PKD2-2 [Schmidtea mediterranea]
MHNYGMNKSRPPTADSRRVLWNDEDYVESEHMDNEPTAMEDQHQIENVYKTQAVTEEQKYSSNGCWWKFKRILRSLWATKLTEDTGENRELYIKTTVRELIIYVVFLTILMIIAFGMIDQVTFYYTKALKTLFLDEKFDDKEKSFTTVSTISNVWQYLFGPFLNGLYWDRWYNGQDITDDTDLVYYENQILGIPRIRQLKVRNNSCEIPKVFQGDMKHCYSEFSSENEDKNNFGLNNSTAWIYTSPESLNSSGYFSLFSEYHDGGFYQDLSRNKTITLQMLRSLFENSWVTLGTRVIFIDFTLYNPNINLFSVMRLIFEFPTIGGVKTSNEFRVVKLLRYISTFDYFIAACEVIFCLFIVYYIVEETIEIRKHKLAYFYEFWNWLDIVVIIISLVCAIFDIYRTASVQKLIQGLLSNENQFPAFDFLSYCQQQFNNAVAINLFIAWIKIFKYISFNKTMTQLSSTLTRSSKDLFGFAVMFFIIFFAFAELGYFIFGSQIEDFENLIKSALTQFRIILGDFDYQQLESAHRIIGPVYFILFTFFVFFVLINMFLAIITDTYAEVKAEIATQKNEFEMADYFRNTARNVLQLLQFKQQKIRDIQDAILNADINSDKKLDYDEWRNELKSRGYADAEIESVFVKYDKDGDRTLNLNEQKNLEGELNIEKELIEKDIEETKQFNGENSDYNKTNIDIDEYNILKRRVDRMEENISDIVLKLDKLLQNFSQLDKMKIDQSKVISSLLEALNNTEGIDEDERRNQIHNIINSELEKYNYSDTISIGNVSSASRPGTARSTRKD